MTSSDTQTVRQVAALARLAIDEREAVALGAQFAKILAHFQVLERLDVDAVEPMTGASGATNVLRDDRPEASLSVELVLANAPARVDDFFAVPKTVGGDE